jgi:hypothetical protein
MVSQSRLEPRTAATQSLAQLLYEASPVSGWTGSWQDLDESQRTWWEAYADLARTHVLKQQYDTLNVPAHAHQR